MPAAHADGSDPIVSYLAKNADPTFIASPPLSDDADNAERRSTTPRQEALLTRRPIAVKATPLAPTGAYGMSQGIE